MLELAKKKIDKEPHFYWTTRTKQPNILLTKSYLYSKFVDSPNLPFNQAKPR